MIGTILGATNNEKKILKLGIINSIFSTPIVYYGSTFGAIGLSIAYLTTFSIFQFYIWYVFKKSVGINIKDKFLMWGLAIVLFFISYFLVADLNLIYKIFIAILIIVLSLKLVVKKISFNL
jgi:hypothetical protein